jgi:predicted dehydrogenase
VAKNRSLNRRDFIKSAAAAGAALAFPTIIPGSALGADGKVAPSNRLVMGALGVGGQGSANMHGFLGNGEVQMVAVCDVDRNHRDGAKRSIDERYGNQDCKTYLDFRELVGRGDLDAVCIAVPDQWHALLGVAALRAGLDVYGEKPLARSIREGRAICEAAKCYNRIWQTGSQQRSDARFRFGCELVRNGRIGKVERVEVGLPIGPTRGVQPEIPVPENLDWNWWLGPAPWRPYCDFGGGMPHWDWRWIMDYSGGQLTDWAGHHIDIAHWGLGLDRTGPIEVEGKGVYAEDGLYDTAIEYDFTCKYATGVEVRVRSSNQLGARWFGEKGWIFVDRGVLEAENPNVLKEEIGPGEIHLYDSRNHHRNFLDCVKSRREPIAPPEIAHRSISVGLLGEIAMLTGRKIRWNPEKEEIIGDPGAAALLGRSYREPWSL